METQEQQEGFGPTYFIDENTSLIARLPKNSEIIMTLVRFNEEGEQINTTKIIGIPDLPLGAKLVISPITEDDEINTVNN